MENISVLTNFMTDNVEGLYYNKLSLSTIPEKYSLYVGGNFIFISNDRNRTIRFSLAGMEKTSISETNFSEWLKRIHALYPGF